jgi:uncharacterized protein
MKRIVIDTNILVSAILKGRTPQAVILFIVSSDDYQWVASPEILTEYKEVLSRKKFKLTNEIRNEWLELIDLVTTSIDVDVEIDFPRDKKDAKFLECAHVSKADFLITGDSDFIEAQGLINTSIVSASFFYEKCVER